MSVTFSGGITFTGGGFSFTAAPPSEPTAAWYAGARPAPASGANQRVVFATDTATATNRGTNNARASGGVATLANGWWGGGYTDKTGVSRVTYATDTAAVSTRGPLSAGRYQIAGVSDSSTYGWMAGGYVFGPGFFSLIERITFATDTATATSRSSLSSARAVFGSSFTTSYGWFAGGSPIYLTTVNRIDYSNDTTTASIRGPLSVGVQEIGGSGDTTYGWFAGGKGSPGDKISTVNRITYATDTATGTTRGPLSAARYKPTQAGDSTAGWVAGGSYPEFSMVSRITYATDTDIPSVRGPLTTGDTFLTANAGQY